MPDPGDVHVLINAAGVVVGGAVRHLVPFANAIAKIRPTWRFTAAVSIGTEKTLDLPDHVDVHRSCREGALHRLPWDSWRVARYADHIGADVILNVGNFGPIAQGMPSIIYQRNSVYFDPTWVHRRDPFWRAHAAARRRVAYLQMRRATAVITPSFAMAGMLRCWAGSEGLPRIHTVLHAVDTARFRFRARQPARSGPLRLLSVASGEALHKDHATAVRMLGLLRERNIDASLTITLDASSRHPLLVDVLDTIDGAGCSDQVHWIGTGHDVEAVMDAHDVLVSCSLTESFGFTLLEGMAVGLPVVAAAIPSATELLAGYGFLFQPGDHRSAAQAVEAVLDSTSTAMSHHLRGARAHSEAYTWEGNARSVAEIIESCL